MGVCHDGGSHDLIPTWKTTQGNIDSTQCRQDAASACAACEVCRVLRRPLQCCLPCLLLQNALMAMGPGTLSGLCRVFCEGYGTAPKLPNAPRLQLQPHRGRRPVWQMHSLYCA
uniref:Uncharacterized protein n=1 Tax=Dunaliella tertiolecta TaxID=3047 RepID=A0A7S3VLF5_DUNTE